jgi:hypothetical protein
LIIKPLLWRAAEPPPYKREWEEKKTFTFDFTKSPVYTLTKQTLTSDEMERPLKKA